MREHQKVTIRSNFEIINLVDQYVQMSAEKKLEETIKVRRFTNLGVQGISNTHGSVMRIISAILHISNQTENALTNTTYTNSDKQSSRCGSKSPVFATLLDRV